MRATEIWHWGDPWPRNVDKEHGTEGCVVGCRERGGQSIRGIHVNWIRSVTPLSKMASRASRASTAAASAAVRPRGRDTPLGAAGAFESSRRRTTLGGARRDVAGFSSSSSSPTHVRRAIMDEVAEGVVADGTRPDGEVYSPAGFSGLEGKALLPKEYPKQPEVFRALPRSVYKKDTKLSMSYAIMSTSLVLALGIAAHVFIPLKLAFAPLWAVYAAVQGTVATGCWVVAHECGHGAFSDNKKIQTGVGYVLHSLLLVPYFSWQRSHAIHHSRTNHLSEGETHVPEVGGGVKAEIYYTIREAVGSFAWMCINGFLHLVVGWPAYLLSGATGGSKYGITNHFIPVKPFSPALFPGRWRDKVWLSDVGVASTLALLGFWAYKAGSVLPVAALYAGPLLFTNMWLVLYTWLQHTDVDVPHYADDEWNWVKGTFLTIDRPYPKIIDYLHHRIGTTHVAHHVAHTIPHYHAQEATECLKEAFPDLYLYDPTPIHKALYRIAKDCVAVRKVGDKYLFHKER